MRVRDILHRDGSRLRLTLTPPASGEGPMIRLGDPDRAFSVTIILDLYGADLLAAFLMSARVSKVGELAEERCHGDWPLRFRLNAKGGEARVELDQLGQCLQLPKSLWDRLYTELQMVLAHGRYLGQAAPAGFSSPKDGACCIDATNRGESAAIARLLRRVAKPDGGSRVCPNDHADP